MPVTDRLTPALRGRLLALLAGSLLMNGLVAVVPARAASGGPEVTVSAFSEKGDFIDNGVSTVYSSHWSVVAATLTGVSLVNSTATNRASFAFAPAAGQSLAVGTYDNLQSAPARSAGFAGIDITGPGRPTGCTRLTGSFQVWDLAADATGTITRLDLTYVEHCGAGRPANYGEVLINDAPRLGALVTSAHRIAFPDQTPTLPYVVMNPTAIAQSISLWQSATTTSYFHVTPVHPSCATTVPAHASCTYLIRLLPPRPGTYVATVLGVAGANVVSLSLSGPAGGV